MAYGGGRREREREMTAARASSCRLSGTTTCRRRHRTTRATPSQALRRPSLQSSPRRSGIHCASHHHEKDDVSSMSTTNSSRSITSTPTVTVTHASAPAVTQKMATMSTTVGALSMLTMMYPLDALAKGGELGLLEGRSFALIHPLMVRCHREGYRPLRLLLVYQCCCGCERIMSVCVQLCCVLEESIREDGWMLWKYKLRMKMRSSDHDGISRN